ncbi:hypothetical protein ABA31_15570 [Agrococcus baldri]|uniref:Secreted protein n=1 Tax=Agrococcus baldri TaxID=153730 RepID=A0AA87URQ4_9MICO|nr:hypothetical protein ABA31_15570 [Agrococcus baldri]
MAVAVAVEAAVVVALAAVAAAPVAAPVAAAGRPIGRPNDTLTAMPSAIAVASGRGLRMQHPLGASRSDRRRSPVP